MAGSALTRRAALTFTAVLPSRRVLGKPCIVPALPYPALSRRAEPFPTQDYSAASCLHEPRYCRRTNAGTQQDPHRHHHTHPAPFNPVGSHLALHPWPPPPIGQSCALFLPASALRPFLPRPLLQNSISATVVILSFSSSFCLLVPLPNS